MKNLEKYINLICLLTVIIITVILSMNTSLLTENYTAILNTDKSYLVFIWGIIANLAMIILLRDFYIKYSKDNLKLWIILYLLLPLSLMFPFQPENKPISSGLHLLFSYLYFIGFNIILYYTIYKIQFNNINKYKKVSAVYFSILGICLYIFMKYLSVNGLFEVIYTISIAIFLYCNTRKST